MNDFSGKNTFNETELGTLPKCWSIEELGSVCRVEGGFAFKSASFSNSGIPIIKIGDMQDGTVKFNSNSSFLPINGFDNSYLKYVLKQGDVLIAMTGATTGKISVVPQLFNNSLLNQRVGKFVLIDFERFNLEFGRFYFLTNNFQKRVSENILQSAQGNISPKSIERIIIPIPPLPEQMTIANILKTVQQAREARLRELELERERKATLMEHLFTHGTRGEPTKQTEIGEMPESWKLFKLSDLLRERLRNGHSARASNSNEGIRTLTLTAVTKNDFSISNTKITVADPFIVEDLWLKPGDVFIERANTPEYVGLAALYEGQRDFAIYPDLMIRVRLQTEKVDPKFLIEFLLTRYCRNYFRRNASSTTGNMPKIDHGVIERTPIPIPEDFHEQFLMTEIFRACDSKINVLEHEAYLLDELFRAMLEELMTGKLPTASLIEP